MTAREAGKWAICRDGRVVIRERIENGEKDTKEKENAELWQCQNTLGAACNKMRIAVWNCNGTLWSNPRGSRDIIFYMETHERLERGLPAITGYIWESAYRRETKRDPMVRGSGEVAVLFWAHLRPVISIVQIDEHVHHMWIKISLLSTSQIFIAVCYFPPNTSSYARQVTTEGHCPYETLYADIVEFSR